LSPPLPSSLASVKPANPGSAGKMAVKTEREFLKSDIQIWTAVEGDDAVYCPEIYISPGGRMPG